MEDIHKHLVNVNNRISIHNHEEKKREMRSPNHTAHSLILKHHFDYENHSKKKHYKGGDFWGDFAKGFEMPFKAVGTLAPILTKVL